MGASIEWKVGVLRVGESHTKPRSPFRWSVTAIRVDDETMEIQGLDARPTRQDWLDVCEAARREGFKRIRFERGYRWKVIEL